MKKNALIFNNDGTLVDSLDAIVHSTNEVIKGSGFPIVSIDMIKKVLAYPAMKRFEFHTGIKNTEILSMMANRYYTSLHNDWLTHIKLYNGIRDSLNQFTQKKFPMGIVSNNQGLFIRKIAAYFGYVQDFEIILGEEDVPAPKPDSSGLLQACAGLGVNVEDSWHIGDGKTDFNAARAAGMRIALVTWGLHTKEELVEYGADQVFESVPEMQDFFLGL